MSAEIKDAIYWLEIDRVVPNPYQPRREFDERALNELADSIKQYGVLQPLVVSRVESQKEDGNIEVVYELIAGERRLRASQRAGLSQVPCVIRIGDTNREKLELAIIENVVREDLNAVERAMAYQRLADEFKLNWTEIAKKVSKSREYVNNTVRILMLPQEMLEALSKGKISEGHTRPLLMLIDRPEEQITLFKEMLVRKMTVREAEKIARKIAFEKVRKKNTFVTPDVVEMENNLAEVLGTRVSIDPKEKGGKIQIDYFSYDELMGLVRMFKNAGHSKTHKGMFDVIRAEGLTPSAYTEDILIARDTQDIVNKPEVIEVITDINTDINRDQIGKTLSSNLNSVMNNTSAIVQDNIQSNIININISDSLPDINDSSKSQLDILNDNSLIVHNDNNVLDEYKDALPDSLQSQIVMDNFVDSQLTPAEESKILDDRSVEERLENNNKTEEDLYNIKDWSI